MKQCQLVLVPFGAQYSRSYLVYVARKKLVEVALRFRKKLPKLDGRLSIYKITEITLTKQQHAYIMFEWTIK